MDETKRCVSVQGEGVANKNVCRIGQGGLFCAQAGGRKQTKMSGTVVSRNSEFSGWKSRNNEFPLLKISYVFGETKICPHDLQVLSVGLF